MNGFFPFQVLSNKANIDPTMFGRRADPWGEYAKRYIPELANMPVEYIYEPWTAPIEVQVCIYCRRLWTRNVQNSA